DEPTAQKTLAQASRNKVPFAVQLATDGTLDPLSVVLAASDEFGTPILDISAFNLENLPANLVDQKLIRKHHALPLFKRGNRIFIGVADPTNLHAFDEIKFNTGKNVEPILIEANRLTAAIETFLNKQEESLGDALGGLDEDALDDLDIEAVDEDGAGAKDDASSEADEAPIVRFINK